MDIKKSIKEVFATRGYVLPMVGEVIVVCKESKSFYENFIKNYDFFVIWKYLASKIK